MLQPKKPVKKYVPTAKEKKNLKDATEQKNMRDPFTPAERKKMPRVGSTGTAKSGKTIKKAKSGFAALAPPFDKATFADKIAGAKKNAGKAKSGTKMKKAMMGASITEPMMKSGGKMKKCKYGCK